jgi:broad specificity phosphatase PhoE
VTGRRLLLLRHGRTAWNSIGRAQGHADVELDDLGHRQAAAAAVHLAGLGPHALWTSDLTRARATCDYLEAETGLVATVDPRLREYDVGARQGLTSDELERAFPEAYAAWRSGEDMVPVPGSEVAADVAARMTPALRDALEALADDQTGIVVTHGACLKVALLDLLGWPQSQAAQLRGVGNGAWATVAEAPVTGRLRLTGYNESVSPTGEGMVDL